MAFCIRAFARPCLGLMEFAATSRVQKRSLDLGKDLVNVRLLAPLSSSSGVAGVHTSNTISAVLEKWEGKFKNEGVSEPKESIQNIVLHVMGGK